MRTKAVLENMISNQELILLYSDKEQTDKFCAGTPVFILDDEWAVLKSVSPDGFFDGYLLKRIRDTHKIESEDKYKYRLDKLLRLRSAYNQSETFDLAKCGTLKELLENTKAKVISILNYEDEFILGKILTVDDKRLKLQNYDFYGKYQGNLEMPYDAIRSINIGGIEESNLNFII